jgi:hypothetical protein
VFDPWELIRGEQEWYVTMLWIPSTSIASTKTTVGVGDGAVHVAIAFGGVTVVIASAEQDLEGSAATDRCRQTP